MREIEGSCNQSSMAVDTSITKELTNNLYNSIKVNGNGTESKGKNGPFLTGRNTYKCGVFAF